MKVYLVMYLFAYDGESIEGIYSTLEKAKVKLRELYEKTKEEVEMLSSLDAKIFGYGVKWEGDSKYIMYHKDTFDNDKETPDKIFYIKEYEVL